MSALLLVAAIAASSSAGPLQDDLAQRRARVMSRLDAETMMIVWSAPVQTYSLDVEYEYRQDSNLLYLTGIEQPGTILVLMPGSRTQQAILFIDAPNARREHWDGHLLTKQEAQTISGIDTIRYVSEFERFVTTTFTPRSGPAPDEDAAAAREYEMFSQAVAAGLPKLALLFGSRPQPSEPLTKPYEFARDLRDRVLNVTFVDALPIVQSLRQVKTPYEQTVMKESCAISSDAHLAGMRAAAPGRYEYHVRAAIEQVFMERGAPIWGYPSIVGSGPNAMILHSTSARRRMEAGDLLLVDAAANYQGLTGDITRTYPVSGRYTPAQKALYQLVLDAQDAGRKTAVPGKTLQDVRTAMADVLKAGLLKLGLITDASGDQFRMWATHGTTHWIGMDVHDVGDARRPLEPGMTFVMEPGLYIRRAALDELPDTAQNRALKQAIAPALETYAGIGVRVEDSFVLTASGLVSLSAKVPRTVDEIEAFLAKEGASAKERPASTP